MFGDNMVKSVRLADNKAVVASSENGRHIQMDNIKGHKGLWNEINCGKNQGGVHTY